MSHGGEPVAVTLARRIYAARLERDRMFPEVAFDQPAWSLMLDLFIARHEKRVVNTFAACIGAGVPQSTALKWLERMEQVGHIVRYPSVNDSRYLLVELTPDALARMETLLVRLAAQIESELRGAAPEPRPELPA